MFVCPPNSPIRGHPTSSFAGLLVRAHRMPPGVKDSSVSCLPSFSASAGTTARSESSCGKKDSCSDKTFFNSRFKALPWRCFSNNSASIGDIIGLICDPSAERALEVLSMNCWSLWISSRKLWIFSDSFIACFSRARQLSMI